MVSPSWTRGAGSVQAQILSLLKSLQREFQLSYLFISHDLAAVRYVAHDIGVLYMGRLVEHGPAASVLARPPIPTRVRFWPHCRIPTRDAGANVSRSVANRLAS
jgi:ABC-type dipeptide/oligopeptide/nickel transport system ATPase component